MLTLKDLKDYDIKNIDIQKLVNVVVRRQDYLLNLVLVLATIFAVVKILDYQKQRAFRLEQEVVTLEKKIKAISEYESAEKDVKNFVNSFPQGLLETNNIINRINDLAVARNIQILSFDPAERNTTELYEKTNIRLVLTGDNYEDIGLFAQDIENSNDNFLVQKWSASLVENRNPVTGISQQQISVEMVISCIYFRK